MLPNEQRETAKEFRVFIKSFLDGEMPADEFKTRYFALFRARQKQDRELFKILERLFEDADAYSPLWHPEDVSTSRSTEEVLRKDATRAVERLDAYIASHPNV